MEVEFEKRNNLVRFDKRNVSDVPVLTSTGGSMLCQEDLMVDENGDEMLYEDSAYTRPIVVRFERRNLNVIFEEL